MTAESKPKPRIETLSDLIFGLALSIGALTLIGQDPANVTQLILSILFYAFSFIILITVWYGYSRNMALLHIEGGGLMALNVLLLFLVTIEPFLFNELFLDNALLVQYASILYALDLGCLFLVQAFFTHATLPIVQSIELKRSITLRRNTIIVSSVFFFVSMLPVFWDWSLIIADGVGIPLRVVLWLIPIASPSIRRLIERKREKS